MTSGSETEAAEGDTGVSVIDYSDRNVTLDAHEDRWAWRARLRRNPATHLAWRSAVGVVGSVVTVGGLIMVPAPGPGRVKAVLGSHTVEFTLS